MCFGAFCTAFEANFSGRFDGCWLSTFVLFAARHCNEIEIRI